MPPKKTPLSGLCAPLSLWRFVARRLEQTPWDHSRTHMQAGFAAYTKACWQTTTAALETMGRHRDCEAISAVTSQVVS